MREEEIIELLSQQDEEFRRLREEHQWLHRKVDELNEKEVLTPAERLRREELKKRKLLLKDRMEEIIEEYRRSQGR